MDQKAQRAALAKVETLLATVVGVQKMVMMSVPDFLAHAQSEIAKAGSDSVEASRIRLSLLYKSVLYTSSVIEDAESDGIKVPVYVCDQTTLGEQSNELRTPASAAALNPAGGSFFEGGLKKFIEDFQGNVAKLAKVMKVGENEEEGDDAQGKRGGKKPPEDAEKSLDDGAFLFVGKAKKEGEKPPRKFPFKDEKGEVDTDKLRAAMKAIDGDEELDDEMKAKLKSKAQTMLDAKKKVGKGLAYGEVAWPDDMNDASFVEKGHQEGGDWGEDDRPL